MMKLRSLIALMQELMGMLKSTMEEPIMSETEAPSPLLIGSPITTSDITERERKEVEQKNKSAIKSSEEQKARDKWGEKATVTATEDKAAKIERLKSGFRICKPQGTFLWPNMAMSPHSSVVHLEDLLVVRTPPSATSATSAAHLLLPCNPASPVKPLAERLPVSNAGILISPPPPPETPQTTFKGCVINLNEPPQIQHSDAGLCGTITYQRRHHNMTSDASMPRVSISESLSLPF
jgi:hypothetical protein